MENYGPTGRKAPITAWAKYATLGVLSHNLHIERYHRTIKMVLKPNLNLVSFCLGLKKINKFFSRKTILTTEGIRGIGQSKSQKDYRGCHPKNIKCYRVEKTDDGFCVTKVLHNKDSIKYDLLKNTFTCNKSLCMVHCCQCPTNLICVHDYSCSCRQYVYGNFCKHSHVLALMKTAELESQPDKDVENVEDLDCRLDCTSNPEDISRINSSIENERDMSKEYGLLRLSQRFLTIDTQLKEKMDGIKQVISSAGVDRDYQMGLIDSLESLIDNIPTVRNPTNFPRKSRKRTHPPLDRSFFP
ncbi:uncharacterized protein LOC131893200 [Tigriopus californicus]|uniref:uncharacterized protein LOC131893200 n=1 Tax=Tigriopus californicus TaxID=6832 RepID=UPI0027DA9942|nr:uncharacterized protein LOC131893200 [Tigriopus californicus]